MKRLIERLTFRQLHLAKKISIFRDGGLKADVGVIDAELPVGMAAVVPRGMESESHFGGEDELAIGAGGGLRR